MCKAERTPQAEEAQTRRCSRACVRAVRRSLCRDPESIQEEHINSLERQAGASRVGLHMGLGFHF